MTPSGASLYDAVDVRKPHPGNQNRAHTASIHKIIARPSFGVTRGFTIIELKKAEERKPECSTAESACATAGIPGQMTRRSRVHGHDRDCAARPAHCW
jgi:hypothetical protein